MNDIGLFNGRRLVYKGQQVDDEKNTEFPGCLIIDTGWSALHLAFHVADKVLYEIVDGDLVRMRGDWSMRLL